MKQIIAIAATLVLCTGCASYSHERVMLDGSTETESYFSLLKVGKAAGIRIESARNGSDYIHNLGVDSVEMSGDAAMVRAIYEAGVAAGKNAVLP